MDLNGNDDFSVSAGEEILIKQLLWIHDPDGRQLDSELLVLAVENVMCCVTKSEVTNCPASVSSRSDINEIEVVGSQDSFGQIVSEISSEMLCNCSGGRNRHNRTMVLFDLLCNYKWNAKVAIMLAALATIYGKFFLLVDLRKANPLAESIATLKRLPEDVRSSTHRLMALSLLVKELVDITKCITKFEELPLKHVKTDGDLVANTKSCIYVASYWISRGVITCACQIRDWTSPVKPEQAHNSTATAVWEITSMVYRLNSIHRHLIHRVNLSYDHIEEKMYQKLLNIFQETHMDNQEVLAVLLSTTDDLTLKNSSTQENFGLTELKAKVVLLLISKPELVSLESLLLLVQETYDHPQHSSQQGNYEILWLPVSLSDDWTNWELERFNFLSNSVPWYSVRKPWALNSGAVKYIKQEWRFSGDPLMVVLDSNGKVSNYNAFDMVFIWGPATAYPFSSSRERELWEHQKLTLQLLVNEIDPLLTQWVEEGRTICIYGGENIAWIRELNTKLEEVKASGVQLERVFVGSKNTSEQAQEVLHIINSEMHRNVLPLTKQRFFWLRLESMRRSKIHTKTAPDNILEQISGFLDPDSNTGWLVIGRGKETGIVKLQETQAIEFGAIKAALANFKPSNLTTQTTLAGPCNESKVVAFDERLWSEEEVALCEKCKRPIKKYIVYE